MQFKNNWLFITPVIMINRSNYLNAFPIPFVCILLFSHYKLKHPVNNCSLQAKALEMLKQILKLNRIRNEINGVAVTSTNYRECTILWLWWCSSPPNRSRTEQTNEKDATRDMHLCFYRRLNCWDAVDSIWIPQRAVFQAHACTHGLQLEKTIIKPNWWLCAPA